MIEIRYVNLFFNKKAIILFYKSNDYRKKLKSILKAKLSNLYQQDEQKLLNENNEVSKLKKKLMKTY